MAVERIVTDPAVKGVIITSGKKEFLAGADIEGLYKNTDVKTVVYRHGRGETY